MTERELRKRKQSEEIWQYLLAVKKAKEEGRTFHEDRKMLIARQHMAHKPYGVL